MKKLFLASAIALCATMNAQTEKGSWVIGGSTTLGFTSASSNVEYDGDSENGPKISTVTITPSVGYFITNNVSLGVDLGLVSITQKEEEDSYSAEQTTNTFSIMPTATYYFKSSSNILPYLGVGVGYGSVTQKYKESYMGDSDNDEETVGGFAYKAKGGIVFLLNQNVGLDLGLSYMGLNGKLDSDDDVKINTNTLGANVGLSVFFK